MKKRKRRTSIIWTIEIQEIQEIIDSSAGFTEVLNKLGYASVGGSYKSLKERISYDNLDVSKLENNRVNKPLIASKVNYEEILKSGKRCHRGSLKRYLLKSKSLENKCSKCGINPIWEKEELIMVLDHINGVPDDNRLENLRFLCPNCNSQTATFSGRNGRGYKDIKKCTKELECDACQETFIEINSKAGDRKYCSQKCSSLSQRKVKDRPTKETLEVEINNNTWSDIGKKYNVSDNTIRKWAKGYKII